MEQEILNKKKFSKEFQVFFLREFTKQLIRHSASGEVFELKQVLKEESKEKRRLIQLPPLVMHQQIKPQSQRKILRLRAPIIRPAPIVTSPLPQRLQHIQPAPTEIEIDLGKLEPLIKDPAVELIECDGSNTNIRVKGRMGSKRTSIILNKEEIEQVIEKFSETSRIPTHEGVFKVALGKLILSAIISEVIGSRFIIKKMSSFPSEFSPIPMSRIPLRRRPTPNIF